MVPEFNSLWGPGGQGGAGGQGGGHACPLLSQRALLSQVTLMGLDPGMGMQGGGGREGESEKRERERGRGGDRPGVWSVFTAA